MKEKHIRLVGDWHDAFGIKPPKNVAEVHDFFHLRSALFTEELQEYWDAGDDIVERADALVDMLYILAGTEHLTDGCQDEVFFKVLENYGMLFSHYEDIQRSLINLDENKLVLDNLDELFEEVNRSNHSKADKNGNPIFRQDGKLLKSELFSHPDLKKILFK